MRHLIIPLSLLLATSCATKKTAAPEVTSSAKSGGGIFSFLTSSPTAPLRPYTIKTLPNGLKIYFLKDDSLPRVSLHALVKVGSVQDPSGLEGLNGMLSSLLDQGTGNRSAEKLAEAFNALGAEFSASAGSDATILAASTLTPQAEELLALYADVLMNPAFAKKEIQREKSQTLSALKRRMDSPGSVVARSYEEYMFANHPYGNDEMGTETSIRRIERADLIRHFLSWYRPNNMLLAVTGRYGPDFEQKVEEQFSKWSSRTLKDLSMPEPTAPDHMTLRLVSKPGLVQAQVRIGVMGVPRSNPDYLKMRIAAEALGGSFASRLMAKIRNELGLTYSISSSIDARKSAGLMTISTFTKNDSAGKTLEETLKVYRQFAAQGITEAELATAKAQMIGQYPRAFETVDGMALQLLSADFYGLPANYLAEFPKTVSAISLKDVNEAIHRHCSADGLKIVVYGDARSIGGQLQSFNPEIIKLK